MPSPHEVSVELTREFVQDKNVSIGRKNLADRAYAVRTGGHSRIVSASSLRLSKTNFLQPAAVSSRCSSRYVAIGSRRAEPELPTEPFWWNDYGADLG
jgi:hypothetical protein